MVFVNLAEHYGGNLTFAELAGALAGQEGNPAVRAMMQILRFQLGCSRTHELLPNAGASVRDYGAGAAMLTEETIKWAHLLIKRESESKELGELKAQFAPKTQAAE